MSSPIADSGAAPSFVISLDFELFWGLKDHVRLEDYRENILGVRNAIPGMLSLFRKYQVRATWATVGMLFFSNREELEQAFPSLKPGYDRAGLSNYELLTDVGKDEQSDPYHFGASLIRSIMAEAGQEVATHSFSHYYCLEHGQNLESFRADLAAAKRAARQFGIDLSSIVFPRNQFNPAYLGACEEAGLKAYRGNPTHWLYQPAPSEIEQRSYAKRALRLADSYLNISGTYAPSKPDTSHGLVNVPASRFLRPYSQRFRTFEKMRLRRIQADLEVASRHGGLYHLWWHPHNFGIHTTENLGFLEAILEKFAMLRETGGMRSRTMSEYAARQQSSSAAARGIS